MAKNIVLLMDGTSNEIRSNRSNILRLYGTLTKSDEQLVYYDPGVGTFGSGNTWSRLRSKTSEVWGMATGWGIDANVKEAYRFLVENYSKDENGERDRIYLFGFSRGAYTARVLAGFLHAFGLMEVRNLNLLDYAYRAYKQIDDTDSADAFEELRLHERIIRPDIPTIRMLGLFDTVASVIESGRWGPRLRHHAFTRKNSSVQSIRHAVAIHERRTMFRPQLWQKEQQFRPIKFNETGAVPQDLKEVWFNGVHGDVGGGYPEAKSALAKLPLYWLIEEAQSLGLSFKTRSINDIVLGKDSDRKYTAPDCMAPPQNSMSGTWRMLEYLPQHMPQPTIDGYKRRWTIPRGANRVIPEGANVHWSVFRQGILPENLPKSYEIDEGGQC